MSKIIENILDECLDRILNKGEDIEQCLKDYPEREELRPVLKMALMARKASASIQPRPEFKGSSKAIFMAHVRAKEREQHRSRKRSFFSWQPRWVTAAIAVLLVFSLGSGVVTASTESMPDNFLYPVKIAVENVRLNLVGSDIARAELEAKFIDRRITEIAKMAEDGKEEKAEKVAGRLTQHLNEVEAISSRQKVKDAADENEIIVLRNTLTGYATDHPLVLEDALERSPAISKATINHVLDISRQQYIATIQNINNAIKENKSQSGISPEKAETIDGVIRMTGDNNWVIGEKVVNIDNQTAITGNPVLGSSAHVEVQIHSDGTTVAEKIIVQQGASRPSGDKAADNDNKEIKKSDDAVSNSSPRTFSGTIKQMSDTEWIVGNRSIIINSETVIEDHPEIGWHVNVTVAVQANGSLLARKIAVITDSSGQSRSKNIDKTNSQNTGRNDK